MVGVFRRSISFPNKTPNSKPPPVSSHHVRSISLPSRSHPLIFQLKDEISNLKSWSSVSDSRTSSWLCDGLNRLKTVHNHLDDILNLPQTQDSLRRNPHWILNLLEHFLRFVDVYGIFQTLILAFKEDHSSAQVAMRKKDEEKILLYVKSRKRMGKKFAKLVSIIQRQKIKMLSEEGNGDNELAVMIEEVNRVTVTVSVALFDGIAESFGTRKTWVWSGLGVSKKTRRSMQEDQNGVKEFREMGIEEMRGLRNKGKEEMKMTMKKMQDLEDWISGIETRSRRVFRSLISARVSLLNSLSQQS